MRAAAEDQRFRRRYHPEPNVTADGHEQSLGPPTRSNKADPDVMPISDESAWPRTVHMVRSNPGMKLALVSMMTETHERGSRDEEQIDLDNAQDVRFWMSELEVSHDILRAAVDKVGPRAKDVRAHVARQFTRF